MLKEEKRLNVGVLGAGPIAQFAHLEACRKARNANLYAICDIAEDLLERVSAIHPPEKIYTKYEEMLADPELDVVIIATSDAFHVPAAMQAARAGKHILVEKPLGVNVEEVEALRRVIEETGVLLQVGSMKRFDPGIAFAKDFVDGELGDVLALKAWYGDNLYRYDVTYDIQPLPISSAAAKRPAGDAKANKQQYYMLAHGSHLVDTARYLGGPLDGVRAELHRKGEQYCWFINAHFTSGALGHLDLVIKFRGDWHEGFQVYGEYGSIIGRTHNPWYFKTSEVECFSSRDRQFRRVLGEKAHPYKLQLEGFADVILHGIPQRGAGIDDGVAAVRGMVAVAQSVATGSFVALADVEGAVL